MMRLLHRSLFSLALILVSFGLANAQGAIYTVQFKASPNREEADEEVRQLKAKNISAYIVKSVVPGKGVFYRVRAGVFSTPGDAKKFGANLQQRGVVSEFFVTNYEKPIDDAASHATPTGAPQTKAPARANQPDANSATAEARPVPRKRTESAPLNSASSDTPSHASVSASKSAAGARNDPPASSA